MEANKANARADHVGPEERGRRLFHRRLEGSWKSLKRVKCVGLASRRVIVLVIVGPAVLLSSNSGLLPPPAGTQRPRRREAGIYIAGPSGPPTCPPHCLIKITHHRREV